MPSGTNTNRTAGRDALFAGAAGGQAAGAFHPRVVLVVDDEADILESLKDILEATHDNMTVLTAASGAEGLQALQGHQVDLILSDYKMPKMNGLEFLAEVRKTHPKTPVVLITAFPDLDIALRAINEAGIEYFLTKPFNPGTVIEVVRSMLSEQRARALRSQSFARSLEVIERARAARRAASAKAAAARAAEGRA